MGRSAQGRTNELGAAVERGEAELSWFFPKREDAGRPGGSYARARALCAACPVRARCLEEALRVEAAMASSEVAGMFGAKTPAERIALRRQRRGAVAVSA